MSPLHIEFKDGTLLLDAPENTTLPLSQWGVYDRRCLCWRASAISYAPLITWLYRQKIPYTDDARAYKTLALHPTLNSPRDYQTAACNAWHQAGKKGVIVLPTGTGKTYVAQLCINLAQRSTLVVVPTIDLMLQWARQLESTFQTPIAMFGGGSKEISDITVITYDSALLMMEYIGNRFGLLIVDECHHLPGTSYRQLAMSCLAPFRLGLSATPERKDGEEHLLDTLLGPICFRKDIDEMASTVLASYETRRIFVDLEEDEFQAYTLHHDLYVHFLRQHQINVSTPDGWRQFVVACARQPGGREALKAYFAQKMICSSGRAKFDKVWEILQQHSQGGRIIIFTADNHSAYELGERFCLPVLTHHTKALERKKMLELFHQGAYGCIVTSKVLNEGVDVPEANIGIVVSGSGSTREHVQRLGRILRPAKGKQAILYELVSFGTSEWGVSDRRRQHRAYERFD